MSLPSELEQLIADYRQAVDRDKKHDLNLGRRQTIWKALGPVSGEGSKAESARGHKRRTNLALAAARRVLPTWSKASPDDTVVERVIDEAESAQRGEVKPV